MTIRFRDLTPEQKEFITNGCGGKGGFLNPPDFIFEASCDHHDFNYWLGYTEEHRLKADRQFYEAMLRDVSRASWWKRPFYRFWAWVYYKSVNHFGGKKNPDGTGVFFSYGFHELGLEELQSAMEQNKSG